MPDIMVKKDTLEALMKTLKTLEKQFENLLAGTVNVEVTIGEIRYIAPLAEVYKNGSIVTSEDLSNIVRKYGKDPRGAAGYFKGSAASMKGIANGKRALTDDGVRKIEEANERFGSNWLDRIPLTIIGDPGIPDSDTITF